MQESAAFILLLGFQVPVHSAELPSARDDTTWLEESVAVVQRQLADVQFASLKFEGDGKEYRRPIGFEKDQHGG